MYPNGSADVNDFQNAGGPGYVLRQLLNAGLMHGDVLTVHADGIDAQTGIPSMREGRLQWQPVGDSGNPGCCALQAILSAPLVV